MAAFGCAVVVLLLIATAAKAGIVTDGVPTDGGCPAIADKPDAAPHVDYQGVQHITYCYGPITISPGQNVIRLRPANDGLGGQNLWPQVPGYITRFDPEFVYADGTVPRVDVLHLHHAVWAVNGSPAVRRRRGEDDPAAPAGLRLAEPVPATPGSSTTCSTTWSPSRPRSTSSGGSTSSPTPHLPPPDKAGAHQVDGRRREPEHLSGLRRPASGRPERHLHVPRPGAGGGPPSVRRCGGEASWPAGSHGCLGAAQSWTPNQDVTLIGTAGHLHPGGLDTQLRDTRAGTDQHALHLQRPLLRAGRRGLVGRRDGGDAADLARPGEGGRHGERARDL